MADLPESATWTAAIYQLETDDPVLGGPEGIDNLQAKQLADRTKWLNANKAPLASPALTGAPTAPTAVAGTNTTQLANTAFVEAARVILVAADALKAPLVSPALTGVPTAPTAATNTNTTQLANTAFVQAAIAALVAASPATLDTLNELAAALGDDPNFATTMTNALAAKASLASPALTGVPTAPTAAAGTNTTQLASTAFVEAARVILAAATALKAPLASPALTGTPTAPTAAAATNTTQVATTAFVQAAVSASGLGVGQTWQDVRASRAANTTYTNSTGKPIMVTLAQGSHLNSTLTYTVSGITLTWSASGSVTGIVDSVSFIVPNGGTYSSNVQNTTWLELR